MPGNIDLTQGIVLNEAADGGGQGGVHILILQNADIDMPLDAGGHIPHVFDHVLIVAVKAGQLVKQHPARLSE